MKTTFVVSLLMFLLLGISPSVVRNDPIGRKKIGRPVDWIDGGKSACCGCPDGFNGGAVLMVESSSHRIRGCEPCGLVSDETRHLAACGDVENQASGEIAPLIQPSLNHGRHLVGKVLGLDRVSDVLKKVKSYIEVVRSSFMDNAVITEEIYYGIEDGNDVYKNCNYGDCIEDGNEMVQSKGVSPHQTNRFEGLRSKEELFGARIKSILYGLTLSTIFILFISGILLTTPRLTNGFAVFKSLTDKTEVDDQCVEPTNGSKKLSDGIVARCSPVDSSNHEAHFEQDQFHDCISHHFQPNLTSTNSIDVNQPEVNLTSDNDSEPAEEIPNGQESIPPQHSEANSRRHNVLTQLLGAVRPRESENPAPASFVGQNNWTLLLTRFLHWSGTVYTYIACFILNVLALYIGIFLSNEISEQLAFKQPTSQPDGPASQPDEPTNQPDEPTTQPDEPTSQPDGPTSQPDEPTSQQNSQDNNPDCQDESEIENRENHRRNGRQKKATNTKVTPTSTFLEAAEVKLTAPPVYNTSYSNTGRRHDLSNYRVNVPPGNFKDEAYRLSTFRDFPNVVEINKNNYARGGFYYRGERDVVTCFACSISKSQLLPSHDPFSLSMHNTTCQFAQRLSDCGNIPIRRAPAGQLFQQSRNVDIHLSRNGTNIQTNNQRAATNSTYQTARVAPARATEEVPFERQLANVIDPAHEALLKRLNLRDEKDRHQTFARWPNHPPTPSANDMAAAGWFYLGNLDRSQCFSCGGVLRNWRVYDNPLTEHKKHFPNCKMAQEREHRNIPDRNSPSYRPPRNQRNQAAPRRRAPNFPLSEQQRSELRELFPCLYANSPHMESQQNRLNTFTDWSYTDASVNEIAAAGFYYLGSRDRVKCWYCNGGLQNWDYNDEPWAEHAKWYPSCEFLLRTKGTDFVHAVTDRYPNLQRPRLRTPGLDVPPSGMTGPSPPVPIVDPQDQMRREARALDEAVRSEVAQSVLGMGFDESSLREVMRSQIEDNAAPYQSASALLEAVLEYEANQSSQNAPTTTTTTSSLFSTNNDPLFAPNAPLFTSPNAPLFAPNAPLFTSPNAPLFAPNTPLFTPSSDPSSISYISPPSYFNSVTDFPTSSFDQLSTPMSSFGVIPNDPNLLSPNPGRDIIDSTLFSSGTGFTTPSLPSMPQISHNPPVVPQSRVQQPPNPQPTVGENVELMEVQRNVDQQDVEMVNEPTLTTVTTSMTSQRVTVSQSQTSEANLLNSAQNGDTAAEEPTEEDKKKLKKRLQELKDELLCKVCLDQKADMVFIPCGHICCCMNCTKALRHCPICRKKIQRAVKTYTS